MKPIPLSYLGPLLCRFLGSGTTVAEARSPATDAIGGAADLSPFLRQLITIDSRQFMRRPY